MTAPAKFKAGDVTRALKGAKAAGERVVLTVERLRQMLAYDLETGEFARFRDGRWHARIHHNGSEYHLGRFDTQEEAGDAYAAEARKLYGEFARPE